MFESTQEYIENRVLFISLLPCRKWNKCSDSLVLATEGVLVMSVGQGPEFLGYQT